MGWVHRMMLEICLTRAQNQRRIVEYDGSAGVAGTDVSRRARFPLASPETENNPFPATANLFEKRAVANWRFPAEWA